MFLLDTHILSEAARAKPNAGVAAFLAGASRTTISIIALHELSFGVEIAPHPAKAKLAAVLQAIRGRYLPTALPIDAHIAESAAHLRGSARSQGRIVTLADSMIAATALAHGLTLVTRNIKDFDRLSVELLNPFSS